jgi:hypothetical protein
MLFLAMENHTANGGIIRSAFVLPPVGQLVSLEDDRPSTSTVMLIRTGNASPVLPLLLNASTVLVTSLWRALRVS